jgi:hypothetical protein
MIARYRAAYNSQFTEEKYSSFLADLDAEAGHHIEFRVAETPIFIPDKFKEELIKAGEQILQAVMAEEYLEQSFTAIPPSLVVSNQDAHPTTVAIDFAVCRNDEGDLLPQLIELQGFPSMFAYQHWVALKYKKHFTIPANTTHLFNDLNDDTYKKRLKKLIVDEEDPQQVVLLEIEPEKQKTRVDFELTRNMLGIEYVCISKVKLEGKELSYEKNGRKIPIKRIYNRVIFDELIRRTDLHCDFHLTEEADVSWANHPNWFFRISKYSMPFIKSPYVPPAKFLNEVETIPSDLENYVLKPLFSFSGTGVIFDIKQEGIENINDPQNFILQRKVQYAPVIDSPSGMVKAEIRLLYTWLKDEQAPMLTINLVRLSKGKMIGVDYNKDQEWVGGSVGFFEV